MNVHIPGGRLESLRCIKFPSSKPVHEVVEVLVVKRRIDFKIRRIFGLSEYLNNSSHVTNTPRADLKLGLQLAG